LFHHWLQPDLPQPGLLLLLPWLPCAVGSRPALLSLTLCIVLEDGNLELCISIFLLASSCCWRPRVASFQD
jgi:hypothetical protein